MMIFMTISGAREATSGMNEKYTDAIRRKSIIATAITTSRGDASETRAKTCGVISETRARICGVISETRAKTCGGAGPCWGFGSARGWGFCRSSHCSGWKKTGQSKSRVHRPAFLFCSLSGRSRAQNSVAFSGMPNVKRPGFNTAPQLHYTQRLFCKGRKAAFGVRSFHSKRGFFVAATISANVERGS